MRLLTSLLLNVVGLGWTTLTAAQSTTDDCYTVLHGTEEAICSASTCIIPKSTVWGEVSVTMTEWVTVAVPTTIYPPTSTEVVTSYITEVLQTTETDVITTPTTKYETITQTTATTAPIVLTITSTSTLRITLCETRDVNPTFTAPLPIPTENTWGCPPGYICKPPQVNCNFERGLPSPDYHCAPEQCVPAPSLLPITFWGDPVTSDESPLVNDTLFFDISSGYFNMNPLEYDLSYDIFYQTSVEVYTTTIYPPAATAAPAPKRQAQIYVPAVCFDECNDAMLEAQAMGKTPALCLPGSAFQVTTSMCELCIQAHTSATTASFVEIQPQFQQFLDYCAKVAPPASTTIISTVTEIPVVSTMAISETVTWSSETYTFIIPTSTVTQGVETVSSTTITASPVTPEPVFTSAVSTSIVTVVSSVVTTGAGPATTSKPPSELSTIPTLTSTVSTLASTAAASSEGGPTTAAGPTTVSSVIIVSSTLGESATAVATGPAGTSTVTGPTTLTSITTASSVISGSTTTPGTGPASTTTPAAPPNFTGAAQRLSSPPTASSVWTLCIASIMFMAGTLL